MKPGLAKTHSPPRLNSQWLALAGLFCAIALGLSGYLLWGALTGDRLPGCGTESGCQIVLHSRWAYFLGVPVSLPAVFLDASVLCALLLLGRAATPAIQQRLWRFLVFAATTLLAAALWFIGLQFFVIKAICPFCMAAHSCGLLAGIVLLVQARRENSSRQARRPASRSPAVPPIASIKFAGAGLAAVAVLVAGQVIYQPKTFVVQPLAGGGSAPTSLPVTGQTGIKPQAALLGAQANPVAAAPLPKPHRMLQLHSGAFNLDLNELPLMGSSEAPNVVVHQFDYTCPHCRALHFFLVEACRRFTNQLAVVSLPMPLAPQCNRLMQSTIPMHSNACEYAYAGLAVWRADRGKMQEFDDWLMALNQPPSPPLANAEAMRLVGTNAFNDALRQSWIKDQLEVSIRLYATNKLRYKKSGLPVLMIGTNIVFGPLRNMGDLYGLLTNQFQLKISGN